MADTLYRYPGAQPFRDNDFSRRTFFGRDAAAVTVTDEILANRLVIVYAKSGLGKTSLLNAGVAQRLRDANTIPLFLRVNEVGRDLLDSVVDSVREEAKRQGMEYVPGDTLSLWGFMKTAEFWHGDILLTPVLVLDQLEELFTLQGEEAREKFLSELSYVVRGVPPPSLPRTPGARGDAAPPLHVVLSLREDFLGLLEEASDRIPQIMDHRFRLSQLGVEAAADAILRPATIDYPNVATRPFRLHPDVVAFILNYLTRSAAPRGNTVRRFVDPFQLQLICQRIERIVAEKQKNSVAEVEFTLNDLGGETALADTLTSFYMEAIQSIPSARYRKAARRMFEGALISPHGRRLSIEEQVLKDHFNLPHDVFQHLLDRRLVRTDRRADSTYYELSHDSLVQPILESHRTRAMTIGFLALIGGVGSAVLAATCALIVAMLPFVALFTDEFKGERWTVTLGPFYLIVAIGLGYLAKHWLRYSRHTRLRYRLRRRR